MLSVAVPLAIVGEVMSHQDKIASLIHDALLSHGSAARIKQLPLPLTAAEASGTWMIMLHRVPSRLDVNAILHQAGMPMTATLIIIHPPPLHLKASSAAHVTLPSFLGLCYACQLVM